MKGMRSMRRISGALMVLMLVLGLVAPGRAETPGADCRRVDPQEAIAAWNRLLEHGVLSAGPAGAVAVDYSPELSRAEAAAVVLYATGRRSEDLVRPDLPPFPDLADHWAAGIVKAALDEGLVQGDPDGTFRPNEKATLEEFQVMLARLLRLPNPTAENAAHLLKQAGVRQEFNCPAGAVLSRGAMLVLLDQALSVTRYRSPATPGDANRVLTQAEFVALLLNGMGVAVGSSGAPWERTAHFEGSIISVGEAKAMLARFLRGDLASGTPDEQLRQVGVDPDLSAWGYEDLTLARARVLVEGALSVPLYARFRNRSDCGYYSQKELGTAWARLSPILRPRTHIDETHRAPVTRAEMATMLFLVLRGMDRPPTPTELPFIDLADHWSAATVDVVKAEGLMRGFPDGTFRPGDTLSLPEVQVVLARLLRLPAPTLENAGSLLRRAGLVREFRCYSYDPMTRGMVIILLDQALSLPIYSRHPGPATTPASNYAGALGHLMQHNIITGRGFDPAPDRKVDRFSFLALTLRGLGYTDLRNVAALAAEQGLTDAGASAEGAMTVGEAKTVVARLLRTNTDAMPVTTADDQPLTMTDAFILLDWAFSKPFYARYP